MNINMSCVYASYIHQCSKRWSKSQESRAVYAVSVTAKNYEWGSATFDDPPGLARKPRNRSKAKLYIGCHRKTDWGRCRTMIWLWGILNFRRKGSPLTLLDQMHMGTSHCTLLLLKEHHLLEYLFKGNLYITNIILSMATCAFIIFKIFWIYQCSSIHIQNITRQQTLSISSAEMWLGAWGKVETAISGCYHDDEREHVATSCSCSPPFPKAGPQDSCY